MAEAYPVYRAGMTATAALLASGQSQLVRKTADTARTNNTVAADPHLLFTVEANAVYKWSGMILYDGHIDGDLNIDFSAPAGSAGEWSAVGAGRPVTGASAVPTLRIDTVGVSGYFVRMESSDVTTALSFGCLGTGTTLTLHIQGILRTSSTAGTFSLDWAQQATLATATTLFTDSSLLMHRQA